MSLSKGQNSLNDKNERFSSVRIHIGSDRECGRTWQHLEISIYYWTVWWGGIFHAVYRLSVACRFTCIAG